MEKIAFVLPAEPEYHIAAISAVQAWQEEQVMQRENGELQLDKMVKEYETLHREKKIAFGQYALLNSEADLLRQRLNDKVDLHVFASSSHLSWLQPALGNCTYYSDTLAAKRGDWDMVQYFDPLRAYRLCYPTERHVAIGFGIMVGADPGSLPDLSSIPRVECVDKVDLLIFEGFASMPALLELCEKNGKSFRVASLGCAKDTFDAITCADMIIGPRSAPTYIASALRQRVVELYPGTEYRRWLSKWDNPNYQMVYGSDYPAGLIWRAMETLWNRPVVAQSPRSHDILKLRQGVGGLPIQVNSEVS